MALKHNNNTHKDNAEPDGEYFNVKPVFILESDIFGSSKPDKNNYLTHTELFKCIDLTIPANHLNGLPRVIGGVWRIYPDSEEDRQSLVVSSITVRKKRIEVYPRNPKYVEKESPTTVIKKSDCNNDWKCKTCSTHDHISKDCTAEFDKNSQADSDVSSEVSMKQVNQNLRKVRRLFYHNLPKNLLDITHTEESANMLNFPQIQTTHRMTHRKCKQVSCVCLKVTNDEFIKNSTISYAIASLKGPKDTSDPVETPKDPNDPIPRETTWTNQNLIKKAYLKVTAVFKSSEAPPAPDLTGRNHFITEFSYGITRGELRLNLIRENMTVPPIVKPCITKNALPTTEQFDCEEQQAYFFQHNWENHVTSFEHNDRVIFSLSITNGGSLKYIDRDKYRSPEPPTPRIPVTIQGITVFRQFTFHWDLHEPFQLCVRRYSLNCTKPPVYATDVTNNSEITLHWNGWADDLAGIGGYEYEVYKLGNDGTFQSEDQGKLITTGKNISTLDTSATFKVIDTGMYSVVFFAIDQAGNMKPARTLFLYDDSSHVEMNNGTTMKVEQARKDTNYVWVDVDSPVLKVKWPGRFKNEEHYKQLWLASVKPRKHVDPEYDDHYGKRKTTTVPHRQGIVRFETQFTVLSPAITQQVNFVSTSDVRDEATSLSVTWNDGDRLDVTVRAYDIFDIFIDDVVTVFKDTSPPKIENLWLSNGDRVNVSVHSFEDFSKMTVEWNAFDYHSGIDNLEWRLYDNYTKTDIIHGHANLHSQGNSENITDCQNKYGDAPRGPSCYCTSFHGCFHKHFYVKPKINKLSGLITGKDKGVHDSDYYIEVTVVNKALLKTTVVKKITIDVSPPHEGYVQDGIRGDPEIDFQQDLHIDAHWEGFFDRESGVEFYQYIFSDHCFNNDEFKANNETTETYNTFASFEASTEGTYFVSVVAVNRAKENSNVVCSDGVTIMTTMPYIKDFLMSGAKTRPRLLSDNDGNIWFLDNMLQRHFVENITSSCIVSNLENVTMLPLGKPVSQNAVRLCGINNNLHILAVVSKEIQFKMSWKPAIDANLIHDYEVGLSSTASSIAPDIVSFRTTKHHTHFRLNHPDVPDGKEFYIIIKSISKSGVEGLQSIGPFIVDTTKPRFSGSNIDVNLINDFLIANWTADAFEDPDDPYPMYFKYAVGHRPNMYDIQSFQNLQIGGPCKRTVPATCTALSVSHLKWSLHGHHDYYFTIKATNLAGLSVIQTSLRYTHDIQLPAEGIVMDVIPTSNLQNEAKDIEDRDFTPETTSLAVRWTGFIHPHQHVNYSACIGTVPSTCDTSAMKTLETYNSYTFKGLNLQPFQKYYVTLEAGTTGGSVKVSSDGIRVLDIHTNLTGIVIRDGNNCSVAPDLKLSHHSKDTRPTCVEDVEFQSSTTSLHVYWSIPSMYTEYLRDAFVQLEERVFGDIWKEYRKFQYVGKHQYITLSNLDLEPGKTYRAVVKFCAEDLCFSPVYGNGITVIVNPPSSGNITVQQVDEPNHHQLTVTFERMYDPDIKDHTEAQSVIHYYEWALGDNVGIHTIWNEIDNATVVDKEHIQFVVPLNNSLDFSKCRQIFIRGYNKAGIWSTISTEIKTCKVNDGDSLIVSNSVIDAIGIQEKTMDGTKRDGYGHDIYLRRTADGMRVWPLLRHKNYTRAVIDSENLDITSYYKDDAKLQLKDPCSHPDSIKCGFTDKEYVNIIFNVNEELEHGKRYIVCIHAPRTEIQFEKWTEVLEETNTCSDGVTVDLTPPTPGHVWIGIDPDKKYQSSSSDIFVSWDAFTDVEEYKKTVHNSGIKEYQIGIGSTKGGTDVFPYTIVGLVNHYTIHDVRLQNGHEYYATVKALDFATRSAIADSHIQ
ncbi:unnamed protein product [Mytilus edulis]|uniref:Uncharacterized protein n=1 Tax=Mytilus edulis TaxID=6550 RepID=A0A8S3QYS2_MYTED|nr:unnamed protein product [Mytilus edulis]